MIGAVSCQLAARVEAPERDGDVGNGVTAASLKFEHTILHLLDATEGPAGSGTLMERLDDLGFRVSEPTVGRFLRALDRRGLTERVSNKGRGLTDGGRARLNELCENESQVHYERELVRSIRSTTLDEIVEVLIARRALERETARLAAERATEEDVALLEETVREQRAALKTGKVAADADVRFHALVAQTSRNRVLAAAIDLIRRDKQITLTLDQMLRRTTHKYAVGHEGIVAAIRARDPAAAEQAMLGHIDTVIADMRAYVLQSGGALPTA
jgi:GntR family transcriptional repressor for pyruvate dehydrogenase complex